LYTSYKCPFSTLSTEWASNAFKSIWNNRCFILPIFYNDRHDLIFIWTTFSSSSVFQLLMIFICFWWRQLLQNRLSSEPLFFRCFKHPSWWFHCSHLFFQNLCFKETLNFCLWSCTLEQILAYPIVNF